MITLTTVGFGDVLAIHPFARSLVMLEAVIGTLYPAILIARLVSLQIGDARGAKAVGKMGKGNRAPEASTVRAVERSMPGKSCQSRI